jgi:hypothetical protein
VVSELTSKKVSSWYRVEVSDHDGQVVAIEPEMLCGRDIGDAERATIQAAIDTLSGFIGLPNFREMYALEAHAKMVLMQHYSSNEPGARCTDCLSGEIRDGRIAHREGCSAVPQPPYEHGGRIMTLEECAEAEGARIEPKMDDETVILRRLLGAAQARIVELEGSYAHHITCNYQNGPIGGDGCICVVLNKHEQSLLAKIAHERAGPPPAAVPSVIYSDRGYWCASHDRWELRETGATVFDSAEDATKYMRYAQILKGEVRPALTK